MDRIAQWEGGGCPGGAGTQAVTVWLWFYRVCPKVTNTFPILPPLSTRFGPPFIAIVTVFRSVYMKRKPRMPSFQLLRMVALIKPNEHTPSPLHLLIKSQLRTRTNPRRSKLSIAPSALHAPQPTPTLPPYPTKADAILVYSRSGWLLLVSTCKCSKTPYCTV